jgi:hypothetical protein
MIDPKGQCDGGSMMGSKTGACIPVDLVPLSSKNYTDSGCCSRGNGSCGCIAMTSGELGDAG